MYEIHSKVCHGCGEVLDQDHQSYCSIECYRGYWARIVDNVPPHYCRYCGDQIRRKRYGGRKPETIDKFAKRMFCNGTCQKRHYAARYEVDMDIWLPDKGQGKRQPDRPWSAGEFEEVKRRYLAGESATKIGESIGRTKNMVIGKLARMGIDREDYRCGHRIPYERECLRCAAENFDARMRRLEALGGKGCRYPHGELRDRYGLTFCGAATEWLADDGLINVTPYCRAHAAVVYLKRPIEKMRIAA